MSLRHRVIHRLSAPGAPHSDARRATFDPLAELVAQARAMERPRVLELGTLRSEPDRSTLHHDLVPHAAEFLGTDLAAGPDVDIVADVHRLTAVTGAERFDVILSFSTFEHLKYPHLAAHELMKALAIGGLLFVQTHQAYPLHAYPYDYFRYSREALAGLFGSKMGFQILATDYEFPAAIRARRVPALAHMESWLNVRLLGQKTAPTPAEYIYDLTYAPAP